MCKAATFTCAAILSCIWHMAPAQISGPERQALENLYLSTGGASWIDSGGWNGAPGSECEWFGVHCFDNAVVALDLPANNLQNALPAELTNLTSLQFLGLRGNQLSGPVPAWIASFTSLEVLDLGHNQFSGPLDPAIFGPGTPNRLWLDNNTIDGAIPETVSDAVDLEGLWLKGNELSGAVPSGLSALESLNYLWLADNQLSGPIPQDLGEAPALLELSLARNMIEEPLPSSLPGSATLRYLSLADNDIADDLTAWLADSPQPFPALGTLLLQRNQLFGSVPASLFEAPGLRTLWLHENQLSGELPADAQLGYLTYLWLADNVDLIGTLPPPMRLREITGSLSIDYENTQIQPGECSAARVVPSWNGTWTPGEWFFVQVYAKALPGTGPYSIYDQIPAEWSFSASSVCDCGDPETGIIRYAGPFQETDHIRFLYSLYAPDTLSAEDGEFSGELLPFAGGSPQPICGDSGLGAPAVFLDRFEP